MLPTSPQYIGSLERIWAKKHKRSLFRGFCVWRRFHAMFGNCPLSSRPLVVVGQPPQNVGEVLPHWGNHETCQDNLACWFGREHHHPAALDQHQVQQKCPHITTEWAFFGYYAICLAVRSKIFHALVFPRWMGYAMGTRLTTCVGKYTDMISNQ